MHSDTEPVDGVDGSPPHFEKIKLKWRTPELDEFIALADQLVVGTQPPGTKRKAARDFQILRGPYSSKIIPADEQIPPKGFPKCLVSQSFLTDELDEITRDLCALSNRDVDIKGACAALAQKLKKGATMDTS